MELEDRIQAKRDELGGRRLTAQELIDVINDDPDEPQELTYEVDQVDKCNSDPS